MYLPAGPIVCLAVVLSGCGGGGPFEIVPVSGKVTYRDGSLLKADQVVVTFVPQDVEAAGYSKTKTTPLEVEVTAGGKNYFSLEIDQTQ